MKEVDFYFDFASPNAYLSLMAGKELEDKLGLVERSLGEAHC